MTELIDPTEPPEEKIRAKHLKNRPLVLFPKSVETDVGTDGKDYEYVQCSARLLDDDQTVADLRVSWWRAVEQIRHATGKAIACKPVEQDDNSVILVPLKGEWKQKAQKVIGAVAPDPDEEPF